MTSAAIDEIAIDETARECKTGDGSKTRYGSPHNESHHKAKLIPLPLSPLQELVRHFGGGVTHPSNNGYSRQDPFFLYIVDLQGKKSAEDVRRSVENLFGKERRAMINYGSIAEVIGLTYDFMVERERCQERYRLCFHGASINKCQLV